jgi:hypothetical protein
MFEHAEHVLVLALKLEAWSASEVDGYARDAPADNNTDHRVQGWRSMQGK